MSDPTRRNLADIQADLEASEAELLRGEIVPGEEVEAMIEAAIERLERKLSDGKGRRAAPHR